MEKSIEKERRVTKTNKHFEIYLEYVEMYNVLKLKWTIQRGYTAEIQNIWHDMTRKLNGCGGPVRDVTHWKKVFTEWKSHTRRKLKHDKPLNDMEKRLVELTDLTNNAERKIKSIKVIKDKTASDTSKRIIDSKENIPLIKEDVDDNEEGTDNSFVEQEPNSSGDEMHSKSNRGKFIMHKEKQSTSDVLKRQKGKLSIAQNDQLKRAQPSVNINDASSSKHRSSEAFTQVDHGMLGMPNNFTGIGVALLSLSNAVNRYCDIVEKRIF